ncbi:MAG TPA: CoA-binding protein, partial [Xanthobacteraceae bacterium]|nr:CoA-binding protein [Xanthobacteraceae bacterium]
MSTYRIAELLNPQSVAVIGGSERESSVGRAVLKNLTQSGFKGPVHLVNAKYRELLGITAQRSVAELAAVPELAVITTPAGSIPALGGGLGAPHRHDVRVGVV